MCVCACVTRTTLLQVKLISLDFPQKQAVTQCLFNFLGITGHFSRVHRSAVARHTAHLAPNDDGGALTSCGLT